GLRVETARCDAQELPFPDDSFDLVFGHAVLHHLPDLDVAFREFRRVLKPGGRVAFCGEPSEYGDRLAAVPKLAALRLAPAWRRPSLEPRCRQPLCSARSGVGCARWARPSSASRFSRWASCCCRAKSYRCTSSRSATS